jgi:hypothetical protein
MAITWTNEKAKLGDLLPWERNPRQIKKIQAERLAESISTFGQVELIAVGPGGEVYNGHQRLHVLLDKFGAGYEVEIRRASRELTEKEREKLTVYLHKGATGEWDFDMLSEWDIPDLLEWGFQEHDLGIFPELPTLAGLKEKFGGEEPGERDFWPVLKFTVSPATKFRFDKIMSEIPGDDEAAKFAALLERLAE